MSTLTSTGAPQAIYPDGLQDAFIIRNNGPYTIYVDSDSSISSASYEIPPTGVMSWDANRPLWLLGSPNGNSSVTITRNSSPAVFTNDTDAVLDLRDFTIKALGDLDATYPLIECTAFNAIQLTFTSATYVTGVALPVTLSANLMYTGTIDWYDRNGRIVGKDRFDCPAQLNDSDLQSVGAYTPINGSRITIPVRGSFFRLYVRFGWDGVTQHAIHSQIVGTTRELKKRMTWTQYETDVQSISGGGSQLTYAVSDGCGGEQWASGGLSWASFAIPGITGHVVVKILTRSTSTTSGLVYFTDFSQNNQLTPSTAIAAGNFVYTELACYLPVFRPNIFVVNTVPKNAGVPVDATLSVTYLDN